MPPTGTRAADSLAAVAAATARRKLARRRRHPRLEHRHHALHRRRKRQREASCTPFASARRRSSSRCPAPSSPLDADLVLLAMGFTGPVKAACSSSSASHSMRAETSPPTPTTATNVPGVFAAGDMRRGQSLVVWAIAEGRKAAEGLNRYLANAESLRPLATRNSELPSTVDRALEYRAATTGSGWPQLFTSKPSREQQGAVSSPLSRASGCPAPDTRSPPGSAPRRKASTS